MVSVWNTLPGVLVVADMIVVFKRLVDKHMDMQGLEGDGLCAGRQDLCFASCSAETLWAEGPAPVMYRTVFYFLIMQLTELE